MQVWQTARNWAKSVAVLLLLFPLENLCSALANKIERVHLDWGEVSPVQSRDQLKKGSREEERGP